MPMKNRKKAFETAVHGVFLVLGLVTVACVLVISLYLIISGIPAIKEIGLINFLFGKEWRSVGKEPSYGILPFILTSIYGTADGFCENYLAHCKFNRQKAVIRKLMRITALIICASVRYAFLGILPMCLPNVVVMPSE